MFPFSILGLGPPLTSNTTEFVSKQVQPRREQHTSSFSLARSSFADVFKLGAGGEAEASLEAAETGLKSGARKHLVSGWECGYIAITHFSGGWERGTNSGTWSTLSLLHPVVFVDNGDNRGRRERGTCHRALGHRSCHRGGGRAWDASQGGDALTFNNFRLNELSRV